MLLADLAPAGLVVLGPVLIALALAHFRTALRWYDWLSPLWRESAATRLSASINRWGGSGFLAAAGMAATVIGIVRLARG